MLSLRLVMVSSLIALTAACGGYSSEPSPTSTPTPGNGPSTAVTIPSNAETLGNRAYAPDNLSVGMTVTWTNNDFVDHTTTSNGTGWNSGVVAPGGTFSVTFQSAGTFPYHCTIHPGMVGTVVVR